MKARLGSQSLRLSVREDGGVHCPETQPPTPFPDDASNQATSNPYINITALKTGKNRGTASQKRANQGFWLSSKVQNEPLGPSSLRPESSATVSSSFHTGGDEEVAGLSTTVFDSPPRMSSLDADSANRKARTWSQRRWASSLERTVVQPAPS